MTSHIGYMCKTDFEMDLTASDAKVYASIEKLRTGSPCVDGCGIVQVEVKLMRIVQEPSESPDGCTHTVSNGNSLEDFAKLFENADKHHKGG